jgi:hypothetical protein
VPRNRSSARGAYRSLPRAVPRREERALSAYLAKNTRVLAISPDPREKLTGAPLRLDSHATVPASPQNPDLRRAVWPRSRLRPVFLGRVPHFIIFRHYRNVTLEFLRIRSRTSRSKWVACSRRRSWDKCGSCSRELVCRFTGP